VVIVVLVVSGILEMLRILGVLVSMVVLRELRRCRTHWCRAGFNADPLQLECSLIVVAVL